MSGHWHRIARWLSLGLTSLALVMGAMPARALPAPRAAVTRSVEQREATRQDATGEASAHIARKAGRDGAPHASWLRGAPEGLVPETRPPGPPRRLFIAHRALLH
jgi:hypothetical protein